MSDKFKTIPDIIIEDTYREMGNAAAMRKALEEARKVIKAMGGYWARETLPVIDKALAKLPRNCNVGIEEELPFEVKGCYIVKTGTSYAVAKGNLAGIEFQCAEMNKAALEWHKQKLAHECASTGQEEGK